MNIWGVNQSLCIKTDTLTLVNLLRSILNICLKGISLVSLVFGSDVFADDDDGVCNIGRVVVATAADYVAVSVGRVGVAVSVGRVGVVVSVGRVGGAVVVVVVVTADDGVFNIGRGVGVATADDGGAVSVGRVVVVVVVVVTAADDVVVSVGRFGVGVSVVVDR